MPRLWRYHLHYFDELASPHFGQWVTRWLAGHPPRGRGTGWEPYPLSRRIPNWIAWLLMGHAPPDGMLASLAAQTQSLRAQMEHHLLGNHLLANYRALVFAECFLEMGSPASGGRATAARFFAPHFTGHFTGELDRQLLADGAHEERSPMYHALILNDLLDLIQLDACYGGLTGQHEHWRQCAGRMLGWLHLLTHPDGGIAFFQDAAFGMAPAPREIAAYAQRLGVRAESAPGATPAGASGYARLSREQTVLLMDAGSPGPAHQPGHAHAGALSVELSHRGQRFLVNSGTSTYEPGPTRAYERSTAAHNTLRLNGRDQSEMWAAFRAGDLPRSGAGGGPARWLCARDPPAPSAMAG